MTYFICTYLFEISEAHSIHTGLQDYNWQQLSKVNMTKQIFIVLKIRIFREIPVRSLLGQVSTESHILIV